MAAQSYLSERGANGFAAATGCRLSESESCGWFASSCCVESSFGRAACRYVVVITYYLGIASSCCVEWSFVVMTHRVGIASNEIGPKIASLLTARPEGRKAAA